MSTPVHAMMTGSFTSDGLARFISLPAGYDSFELINITDIGDAGATTQVMRAKGYSSLPAASAYLNLKTNGAATLAIESMITAAGFTFVADSGAEILTAPVAITAISQAGAAVASSASPAVVGDVVRIYGTTAQLQSSGFDYTVTAVNPGVTQTLGYLNSAGFAAAATAGWMRIVVNAPRFYPRTRQITAITQAASAVVTMSVAHGFTVGQVVRVMVPAGWGMTEINGKLGTVTAVSASTITLDINSTAMTAFAHPTSAQAAVGISLPLIVPVGEAAKSPYENLVDDASYNASATGVIVGTGVQTTGKLYQWIARRGLSV